MLRYRYFGLLLFSLVGTGRQPVCHDRLPRRTFHDALYGVCPIQSISVVLANQPIKSAVSVTIPSVPGIGLRKARTETRDGTVNESITMNGPGQSNGRVEIRLKCDADNSTCISPTSRTGT